MDPWAMTSPEYYRLVLIPEVGVEAWAEAIAGRLEDGLELDSEDRPAVREALKLALVARPESMVPLIGTEIIEESYFEDLEDEQVEEA